MAGYVFQFKRKSVFVIPIQVAKVYLCFICQFSIIRIVHMVCNKGPDVREPDRDGNQEYCRRNQAFVDGVL